MTHKTTPPPENRPAGPKRRMGCAGKSFLLFLILTTLITSYWAGGLQHLIYANGEWFQGLKINMERIGEAHAFVRDITQVSVSGSIGMGGLAFISGFTLLLPVLILPLYYLGLWLNLPLSLLIGLLMCPVDLVLQGRAFSVRVIDDAGLPLEDAGVRFGRDFPLHTRDYDARTDSDGVAAFRVDPRHFNRMRVSKKDYSDTARISDHRMYESDAPLARRWLRQQIAAAPDRRLEVVLYPSEDALGLEILRRVETLPREEARYPWDVRLGLHPPHGKGEHHDFTLHVHKSPGQEVWAVRVVAAMPGSGVQAFPVRLVEDTFRIAPVRNTPPAAPVDGYMPEGRFRYPFFFQVQRESGTMQLGVMTLSVSEAFSRENLLLRMEQHLLPPGETRFYRPTPVPQETPPPR